MGGVVAPVIAHIEGRRGDREPLEVSLSYEAVNFWSFAEESRKQRTFLGNITFPASWKPNHHHADAGFLGPNPDAVSPWSHFCCCLCSICVMEWKMAPVIAETCIGLN